MTYRIGWLVMSITLVAATSGCRPFLYDAHLTSTAMVVFDLPVATRGQCGQTAAGSCVPNASGSTMRCRY